MNKQSKQLQSKLRLIKEIKELELEKEKEVIELIENHFKL